MTWLLTRGILAHVDDAYEWVSTREAAARIGVSPSTVERLVRRGQLVAERVERPGGTRLLIRLDRPQEPRQAPSGDGSAQEALATPGGPQATSGATMDVPAILAAAIHPYVAMSERIGELYAGAMAEVREQAETIGALRERVAELERRRPWWRWLLGRN